MPTLRKMLGKVDSPQCVAMMRLIETQSHHTLAVWAVAYAQKHYLEIYERECPGEGTLKQALIACGEWCEGGLKLQEIKPLLAKAGENARGLADNPTAQAAARAISTACATVQTPTNALGFLFYGAAAVAYGRLGLKEKTETYDALAAAEFLQAQEDLRLVSVPNERNPAKIKWNC